MRPDLATLLRVMKRPVDLLHPVAPISQPNEGASHTAVKNEPTLRAEKREIHLLSRHREPPPEPRVISPMIDETANSHSNPPNRAVCEVIGPEKATPPPPPPGASGYSGS